MSSAMAKPSRSHDVHMSTDEDGMNFRCQDCHKTRNHMISGRSISVPAVEGDLSCEYCHTDSPHVGGEATDHHLNKHTAHVACQTCHIPVFQRATPPRCIGTGPPRARTARLKRTPWACPPINKKKGSFEWVQAAKPEYRWYNGTVGGSPTRSPRLTRPFPALPAIPPWPRSPAACAATRPRPEQRPPSPGPRKSVATI
jgi:Zn finger protein HypA/HybF involved in hydrogenase expression